MTNRQRRAIARGDEQIVVALEHDGQRKRPFQPLQRGMRSLDRLRAPRDFPRNQMRHHFRVGLGRKFHAIRDKFGAQFGEILDDAIVHDGHAR